jgi:hypothetical protein
MKQILLILGFLIISSPSVYSEGLYICTNDDGSKTMTNNPPQNAKCVPMGGTSELKQKEPLKTKKDGSQGQSMMENPRMKVGQATGGQGQRFEYEKLSLQRTIAGCKKNSPETPWSEGKMKEYGARNDREWCINNAEKALRLLEENPGYYFYILDESRKQPPIVNIHR